MSLGLVMSELFERHIMPPGHPERPERLRAVAESLILSGIADQCTPIEPRQATREEVLRVHTEELIAAHEALHARGGGEIDPDTYMGPRSWPTALLAAGSTVAAAEAVADGAVRRAFVAPRPPGHHACSDRAMGFCLLNSVAIAARHLIETGRAERILIADIDVHHGNGTQEIFYHDPRVVYVSVHQGPHFPGTGWREETGAGSGEGTTFNRPHPAHAPPALIIESLQDLLDTIRGQLPPDFVFISVGFDGHRSEPLAGWILDVADYVTMTRAVLDLADETADGRVVSVLEGGYNLTALAECTEAHVRELL